MAAVEVTITGMLYDKLARTTQNVVLIGEASLTGVGIGGGPVIPPSQPPAGGGGGGHPEFPIALPPGSWGPGGPPGPGYPPSVEHPIAPPPNGDKPPEPVQPPIDWKAVWHPQEGWIVVGIPNVPHPSPS